MAKRGKKSKKAKKHKRKKKEAKAHTPWHASLKPGRWKKKGIDLAAPRRARTWMGTVPHFAASQ